MIEKRKKQMNARPTKFEKDPYVISAACMYYVHTYLEGEP
jgi:hypothetical protein